MNGDYNDIKEENNEFNMQNIELEIANGILIAKNELLNDTLQPFLKNDDHQINNSIPNNTDVNTSNMNNTELINILMIDYNETKTELKILQSKYAELNINFTQIQKDFNLLREEYQTYGL